MIYLLESVRLVEEAVLKTVGCKRFQGSIPWLSAMLMDIMLYKCVLRLPLRINLQLQFHACSEVGNIKIRRRVDRDGKVLVC